MFALDINQELLDIIRDKAKKENLINIKPTKVNAYNYDIEAESVDIVMMVTVYTRSKIKTRCSQKLKEYLKKQENS